MHMTTSYALKGLPVRRVCDFLTRHALLGMCITVPRLFDFFFFRSKNGEEKCTYFDSSRQGELKYICPAKKITSLPRKSRY